MKPTPSQKQYIKGYAQALQDLMWQLTEGNTCAKSYDPIEFDNETLHSYAFDLKDGGRHHPLSDYESIEEITRLMLKESAEWCNDNQKPKQYPINGFAPGFYNCICGNCKAVFMGDKRAVRCEPCATLTC